MADLTHTFASKLAATHWGKAVDAALIAGVLFLAVQMLVVSPIQGVSPWLPVRMIAAIALGTRALPETGASLGVLVAAFLVHFGLSLMTAWILAPLVQGTRLVKAALIGAALGLVIYLVNFYLLTAAYTWFAGIRGWATLINHLLFGAVMAWVYEKQRLRAGSADARLGSPVA
jgi:hypothetical protein